jgi:hypothetical protein
MAGRLMFNPKRRWIAGGAAALLVAGGVVAAVTLFRWHADATTRGRAAADRFHDSYEAGDFGAIYGASAPSLRQALTEDDATQRLGEVRARLGRVVRMSDGCALQGPSRFGGEGLRTEYRVTFANGEAWETYDWALEGDDARLLAYAVETGFEDGSPDWEVALAPPGVRPNATSCAAEEDERAWWEG